MKKQSWIFILAGLLAGASASATMVINFDDGATNPFSAGTISTDQSYSGNYSLLIGAGNQAVFNLPASYAAYAANNTITVSMRVFDTGRWIDSSVSGAPGAERDGPRWGVNTGTGGTGEYAGANITHVGWLGSGDGYGYNDGENDGRFATWWSQLWYGGPRQVTSLGDGGSNDGSGWVPSTEGVGAWSEWTFTMDPDGTTTIQRDNSTIRTANLSAGGMTAIFLAGRTNNGANRLGPIYVDDITIIPEPGMLGLLSLGMLALMAVKRKAR